MHMKKQILFIMPTMEGGGAEKVLHDVFRWFDFNRYDVSLLLMRRNGVYYGNIPKQVKIYALEDFDRKPPKYIVNRFTLPLWEKYRLSKILPPGKFDAIISFMEGEAVYYHQFLLNKGRKNVSWVHIDLYTNHWTRRFFHSEAEERSIYEKMDCTVFVSRQAKDQFEKLFGREFPSRVIYNIIDKRNIRRQAKEPIDVAKKSTITICNIGRLSPQKRQDRLIEAIAILNQEMGIDSEAWILGKGDLEPALRKQAHDLSIADKISFLGFRKNPYPYLRQSDCFVLSSDSEGFSLVVAEALCLGKPVVSTRCAGPVELLEQQSGMLAGFSSRELAEAIARLFESRDVTEKYAANAFRRSEIFDPEETMSQIYSLF